MFFKRKMEKKTFELVSRPASTQGTILTDGNAWLLKSDGYYQAIVEHICKIEGRIDDRSFRLLSNGGGRDFDNQNEFVEEQRRYDTLCQGGSCLQGFREQPVLVVSHNNLNNYSLEVKNITVASGCTFVKNQ